MTCVSGMNSAAPPNLLYTYRNNCLTRQGGLGLVETERLKSNITPGNDSSKTVAPFVSLFDALHRFSLGRVRSPFPPELAQGSFVLLARGARQDCKKHFSVAVRTRSTRNKNCLPTAWASHKSSCKANSAKPFPVHGQRVCPW